MTLTTGPKIYTSLEQGTDEWVAARCGLLTASQLHKLITPTLKVADNDTSRGLTETLVAERITGRVEYVHPSFDMQRGTMDEPYARDQYAEQYGTVYEIGFATNEFNGYKLGASPDGLIAEDGGLEIKSRNAKAQLRTILSETIPAEHLAQIHACMLVLNRQWWDYCSYAGGWPLFVKRVMRDPTWDALIIDVLGRFEINAAEMMARYNIARDGKPIAPLIDHYLDVELKL